MHPTGILQKADDSIAMIEKREELNIKHFFSTCNKEIRAHLVLCILRDFSL